MVFIHESRLRHISAGMSDQISFEEDESSRNDDAEMVENLTFKVDTGGDEFTNNFPI